MPLSIDLPEHLVIDGVPFADCRAFTLPDLAPLYDLASVRGDDLVVGPLEGRVAYRRVRDTLRATLTFVVRGYADPDGEPTTPPTFPNLRTQLADNLEFLRDGPLRVRGNGGTEDPTVPLEWVRADGSSRIADAIIIPPLQLRRTPDPASLEGLLDLVIPEGFWSVPAS